MGSQALILSRDPESSQLLRSVLREFDVAAELCFSTESAARLLEQRRFESVVLDLEAVPGSEELLPVMRASAANRDAVAVTVTDDPARLRSIEDMGANFVLHKPIPTEDARRIMRIARHLVQREGVRRYLRLPISQLAYALLNEEKQILVNNVSEGGLAIQADEQLQKGQTWSVRFSLPAGSGEIHAEAEVAWADVSGRAGLHFVGMDAAVRQRLRAWIERTYSSGAADTDGNRRVIFDQPKPAVLARRTRAWRMAAGLLLDCGLVAAATAIFAAAGALLTGSRLAPRELLTVGALLGATYGYMFLTHRAKSPGQRVSDLS